MIFFSSQYAKWEKETVVLLKQNAPKTPLDFVSIIMTFFLPDKRKTDLRNKAEGVFDSLVLAGIIVDDDWTCVNSEHYFSGGIDRDNPRVEIEIVELTKPEDTIQTVIRNK